jgi:hypothetical protein
MKPYIKVFFVDYHQATKLSIGRRATAAPGVGWEKSHRRYDICKLVLHVTPLVDLFHSTKNIILRW